MPCFTSACAMSAWMSEKPTTKSGSSLTISSMRALVKADTLGFSRRARGGRTVKPEIPTMRCDCPSAYNTSVGSSVRQTIRRGPSSLHAAPILAPDLEERVRDLAERADARRVHQHLEDVGIGDHGLAQALQRRGRLVLVARVEVGEPLELALLLLGGRACQLELRRNRVSVRIAERVDADDRIRAVVLAVLVVEALFLDLAALVAGLHRTQHAAAARDRLELLQHRFLDQVRELVDDERTLVG